MASLRARSHFLMLLLLHITYSPDEPLHRDLLDLGVTSNVSARKIQFSNVDTAQLLHAVTIEPLCGFHQDPR